MIIVLSPAKTLDYEFETNSNHSIPAFLSQSTQLIGQLKKKEPKDIASLMGLSDKLAALNYDRYQSWTASKNISSDSKQSMLVFKGDVYQGLQAEDLSEADMKFAQKHIRILSGLYGILKPLDVMKPYRLEMGTKLETPKGKNLYEFWGNKITDKLNQNCIDSKNEYLINLASNEYFDSVNKSELLKKVVTPKFLDKKNGNYKVISFFAKKARGAMASYIIKNKIQTLDELQNFQGLDYKFCTERSDSSNLVFIR